jgi:HlyD family secretion protein
LVRLTAAEDSFVLTIAKVNVGSVMKAGDTLMSLAPAGAPIEAEVQMAARDVGFVRPGDPATLKIDAFNFAEHGTAEGTVRWISEGSFTRDDNGMPVPAYYKARLAIDSVNLTNVPPSFRLIPGMTLTADIKVGTRSLGAYILGGLLKTLGSSMREP